MSRKFWLFSSVIVMVLVFVVLDAMEDTIDIKEKEDVAAPPEVVVVTAKVASHTGAVRSFAEVKPRWSARLTAQVSGEIVEMSEKALAGEQIDKGDVLLQIEDSTYKARLADARQALAQANLNLLKIKKKANRAYKDWKRSGLKSKPSALALQVPQLNVARKTVAAAVANLKAADKKSSYTQVSAPFSGIVTERFVSIGQTVNTGDPLLHALNQDYLDITVSLSDIQWKNLAKNKEQQLANIKNTDNELVATASIKRGGGFLDPKTRQYKLFLEIEKNQKNSVLAGEFVNVELPGRVVTQSLLIPASAYTREATVWYVDTKGRLGYFASDILFYRDDHLIVSAAVDLDSTELKIVLNPLASFVSGRAVTAIAVEDK